MAWSYDAYLPVVTRRESGGNPNAKNPRSSASGLFQFLDDTYMAYARRLYPRMSEGALMARKNDVATQNEVMRAFTEDNANRLSKAGIPLSNGSVYAAHFLGPAGAIQALRASDDTPINQVVSADAIKANPGVFKNIRTAGDFKRWAGAYGGGAPADQSATPMELALQEQITGGSGDSQLSGGAGTDTLATEAQPQSMWDQFLSGGPGALFGAPVEDYSFSDGLIGAGAALMARDNPQGAAALASALRYKKDGKTKDKRRTTIIRGADGATYEYNQDTGENRKLIDAPAKTFTDSAQKTFIDVNNKADTAYNTLDRLNTFRKQLVSGELSVDALNRVGTSWRNILDGTTPATGIQDRNAALFYQWLHEARDAKLLDANGVQTEGDAQRAMESILPGTTKFSNQSVSALLDQSAKGFRSLYDRNSRYGQDMLRRYGGEDGEYYNQQYSERTRRLDDFEPEYVKRRDEWLKNYNVPTSQGGDRPTVTGRPERTQQSRYREGQTATGPNGEKIIFQNGRWVPLKQ
ncbi:hypothetical protein GGR34_000735 [Microvirga flocculans]|uniref:Transglycosylase SLT domain-containing protein n=1 Tax=Microvirga flocculans TaxID=217168 RepID=A0A7W6IDX1_9HYPH|nr:transglycosylase SLT domain-containing protein [Microvirga flocculans]MBB4039100.1 hypothetical protein [Microvirga flocculans]